MFLSWWPLHPSRGVGVSAGRGGICCDSSELHPGPEGVQLQPGKVPAAYIGSYSYPSTRA